MNRATFPILVVALFLASCDDEDMSLTLINDSGATMYFGDSLGGALWLGKPVYADAATGQVTLKTFGDVPWGDRCAHRGEEDLKRTNIFIEQLKDGFGAASLRESIAGKPEYWKELRPRIVSLKNPEVTADSFSEQFTDEGLKRFAKLIFPLLKNPALKQDMEPSAMLGFSRRSFSGGASVGVGEKFSAGLSLEKKTLHGVVVARTGMLALDDFSLDCVLIAAKALASRPTYIVDALSLGVLFQFDIDVKKFSSSFGGNAEEVQLSGKVKKENVRINAVLHGKIKPTPTSLFDIYDPKKKEGADVQLQKYFSNFSEAIETPVFVSAHLTAVQ